MNKRLLFHALAEAKRRTRPSERDILTQSGEYNQWRKDVTVLAEMFGTTYDELLSRINMEVCSTCHDVGKIVGPGGVVVPCSNRGAHRLSKYERYFEGAR